MLFLNSTRNRNVLKMVLILKVSIKTDFRVIIVENYIKYINSTVSRSIAVHNKAGMSSYSQLLFICLKDV